MAVKDCYSRPSVYRNVKRKDDEDCVKKCMEIRIEGRRSVKRPVIISL